MKDRIFRSEDISGKFRFDEKVAGVFDDMLRRSVPFYKEVQEMVASLAADYFKPGKTIYDLGCSTGNTMIRLSEVLRDRKPRIVGVDSSRPVIEKARKKIADHGLTGRVELICADVMDVPLTGAGVVIMNYTLQFIAPERRPSLLKRIYDALTEEGVLLLSEKVTETDPGITELFIEKHHDFKKGMGYSEMEISKKREALEEVLIPLSMEEQIGMLHDAGFGGVAVFFKWFNFASFIAVKSGDGPA